MECHEQKHHEPDLIVLLLYRCLVRTKSHKARQKAAGIALSVKLEKYLSRPDYEGHISFIETFHEELPQDGIGCHRGIRTFEPRDADSERDLSESARVTKYLLIATHNLAFALRCNRVPRLHRGHVEEVAPESLRRESRCRQKVLRLWTFSGTVRTNGRTGSAAGLQVVVAMLQRNGSRVRSIMNLSP